MLPVLYPSVLTHVKLSSFIRGFFFKTKPTPIRSPFMHILIELLYILIFLSVVALILWVFERYIWPVPNIVKGIVILIAILGCILWLSNGHSLALR